MDLVARVVLFATEGRDTATVKAFAEDLAAHGGGPAEITNTSSDMSPAFISGIGEHLPNAEMTFDRYHEAERGDRPVAPSRAEGQPGAEEDPLRVAEERQNLTATQRQTLAWLTRPSLRLATARAHRWREDFQAFYDRGTDDGIIGTRLPTFHVEAADQAHVASMPDTTWPVNGHPPDSSRRHNATPVLVPPRVL
jgi:transposase